jgi:hypothetical protein
MAELGLDNLAIYLAAHLAWQGMISGAWADGDNIIPWVFVV